MFKKILIPTDGSDFPSTEIEKVSNLIDDDGEIIILSVAVKLVSVSPFQSKNNLDEANEKFLNDAYKNVDKLSAKFKDNLNVQKRVIVGNPADTIMDLADEEDADLIVLPASKKSNFQRIFIGSVADVVLKHCKRDILLIHT